MKNTKSSFEFISGIFPSFAREWSWSQFRIESPAETISHIQDRTIYTLTKDGWLLTGQIDLENGGEVDQQAKLYLFGAIAEED